MTIAPRTGVGHRPHRVTLQNPGPPIDNGDNGFTRTWTDLAPAAISVEIKPATQQDLERAAAGTAITTATHLVTGPFHPGVTTDTRLLFNGREFHVQSVQDPGERHVEMILLCTEVK
jgi:SPP1 family predicted phage head-tail adaptor